MRPLALAAALSAAALASPALAGEAPDYAPLMLYQGGWVTTPPDGGKTVRLDNACGRIGALYGCEQTVDGKPGGWILFVPAAERGRWKTQHITPDGGSSDKPGDLAIDGELWTYMGDHEENGVKIWTRVINRFSGPDHIHFEIARSTDGSTWTVLRAGDEARSK
jgi:hypothetical protein